LFGVANKPVAPANMVYIGVVTRVQQNNGEIFVNVQNGFEIEELHDVLIQSKANNQGLFYESSTGLWKNKSIATVLGYTPQAQLNGTGFVKASGTTISYDNSTYLTTGDAASTYQTLANLSTDLTASATKYPSVNAVIAGLATKQPLDADLTAIAALAGTSGFLIKTAADTWSLDTNTYLTTATAASTYQRLDKMVSNLLASDTEYPNSNAVIAALALKANAANPVFTGNMTISGAEPKLFFTDTDNNPDYTIFIDSGIFYIYDQTAGATRFSIGSTGNISAGVGKSITADSFIKDGGTAAQFLKADGSIDSSTYVTSASLANYLLITTAASTYQRLDKMVSNLLASDTEYPNSNAVLAKLALKADAANPVFTGDLSISGATPRLYFVDTDQNPDYTVFIDSGFFYIYDQTAGATRFSINSSGNISTGVGKSITAGSIIKDGGTASQFLKADGTIDSNVYVTGGPYLPLSGGTMTGTLNINGLGYGNTLVINTNNPNGADITLINTGAGGKRWDITSGGINNGIGAGGLQFFCDTDGLMRMGIASSGNVLIGTTTDSGQKTQINGGAVVPLKLETTNTFSGIEFYRGGSIIGFMGTENTTEGLRYNSIQGAFQHRFYSNAVLAATISNAGAIFVAGITANNTSVINGDLTINKGLFAGFSFAVSQDSTFAFGSTNGRRTAIINYTDGDRPGLQFGYDATANTGIIAGSTQSTGAGLDFYTYNGSSWANRVRITKEGRFGIGQNAPGVALSVAGQTEAWQLALTSVTGTAGAIIGSRSANTLSFGDWSGNEKIRITGGGILAMNGSDGPGSGGLDKFSLGFQDGVDGWLQTWGGRPLSLNSQGNNVLIGTRTSNGYKLQVADGNTWSNGVRIGRDFSISNRATVRIDSRAGDNPADILFGRDDAATQTSWNGVFWSISSRGSGEGNEFRIYRGIANTGSSEIVAMNINPSAGAVTFINTVTATSFFESSDFRLKTLIEHNPIVAGIEKLQAKLYEKNGKIELGYFAQDAEMIMPYAVTKNEDGFLNLSYREVHTAKIARLEKEVAELKEKLNLN
jgi:hypothetical protein